MKKTIKYLVTLMAAALAADCLLMPSEPPTGAGTGSPVRTVAASATGAVTALSEAQDATRSAARGNGPRSRSLSVLASPFAVSPGEAARRVGYKVCAGRGGRDGTEVSNFPCNLGPSSAYAVRSRTIAPIVADPSGAFGVGYVSATGADTGREHDLKKQKREE